MPFQHTSHPDPSLRLDQPGTSQPTPPSSRKLGSLPLIVKHRGPRISGDSEYHSPSSNFTCLRFRLWHCFGHVTFPSAAGWDGKAQMGTGKISGCHPKGPPGFGGSPKINKYTFEGLLWAVPANCNERDMPALPRPDRAYESRTTFRGSGLCVFFSRLQGTPYYKFCLRPHPPSSGFDHVTF